jgi:3-oxoadipate enol-lactonase/4-carboxymuconolactone decarboxylase
MNDQQQATRDARPSGASIRQRVFGAANGQPTAQRDAFLAPFFQAALDHVWGGLWNRPGLELKYRSLVVVSALAATGHHEELKTHLRGALHLGWTADELREALLQIAAYVGFSAAHEALDVLSEIVKQG